MSIKEKAEKVITLGTKFMLFTSHNLTHILIRKNVVCYSNQLRHLVKHKCLWDIVHYRSSVPIDMSLIRSHYILK